MKRYIAIAVLSALASYAAAQAQPARPHPADPAASVPAAKYESAFSSYRGFREEPLAQWRGANDEVARVGGHAGIVGDAGQGTHKPVPDRSPIGAAPGPTPQPKPALRNAPGR